MGLTKMNGQARGQADCVAGAGHSRTSAIPGPAAGAGFVCPLDEGRGQGSSDQRDLVAQARGTNVLVSRRPRDERAVEREEAAVRSGK